MSTIEKSTIVTVNGKVIKPNLGVDISTPQLVKGQGFVMKKTASDGTLNTTTAVEFRTGEDNKATIEKEASTPTVPDLNLSS